MLRVKGTWDGEKIVLVEPLPVPAQTPVEVLVAESAEDDEQQYWDLLAELGIVLEHRTGVSPAEDAALIHIDGEPLSATIIRERR